MKRVIAWVLFAGAVYGIYLAAHAFKNPLTAVSVMPTSPVISNLPPASNGCGVKCRYD